MDTPKTIDWFITSKCNLKCDFCYGPIPENENRQLAKKVAKVISMSNVNNVTLCGGEPLVSPDLNEIIDILKGGSKKVYISTNGHFPKKLISVIDKLSGVSISLDSDTSLRFINIRGHLANFEKVENSINIVKNLYPDKLKITTVLSKKNIEYLDELSKYVNRYNPKVWRILRFVPRMKGYENKKEFEISDTEFECSIGAIANKYPKLNIYASSYTEINSCFLIDYRGDILLPKGSCYRKVGNCLDNSIEKIWECNWEHKDFHYRNKIWMKEIN